MITLLHGDNQTALRNHLNNAKVNFNGQVLTLDSATLHPEDLMQALQSDSLFGDQSQLVIIDNILDNKSWIDTLSLVGDLPELILVQDKPLTKTQISALDKVFGKITPLEFKIDPIVFKFFDTLEAGAQKKFLPLWQQYKSQEAAEVILVMLARQFRLLLLSKQPDANLSSDWTRLSPWQQQKLSRQAATFSQDQLQDLISRLSQIDHQSKTSASLLDLADSLELLLLTL